MIMRPIERISVADTRVALY